MYTIISGRTRADLIICGFIYDAEYGKGGPNGDYQSPTGANHVKHLYGNNNDHVLGLGVSAGNMYSGLATHILRLSDIYLVYAEAKMGLATSTTDQSALDAFNAVRGRAIPGVTPKTSITWEDVVEGTPAGTGLRRRPLV